MIIENISLTTLRVFDSVFRTRSMSKSSKLLFLTQPGVSQHIKTLEHELEVKLFDRVARRLIPTPHAQRLHEQLSELLKSLSNTLEEAASKEHRELSGEVKLGLPIEVGNNLVLKQLAQWSKIHPRVRVKINYDHIHRQIPLLLDGELDFAITDSYALPKEMNETPLFEENHVLCCHKNYAIERGLNQNSQYKVLKELDYIAYLDGAPIINQWFNFHFEKDIDISPRATIMDVQGVLKLITHELGLGILPLHVLQKQNIDDFIVFSGNKKLLKNRISLVYHSHITQSEEATSLIVTIRNYFTERMNLYNA